MANGAIVTTTLNDVAQSCPICSVDVPSSCRCMNDPANPLARVGSIYRDCFCIPLAGLQDEQRRQSGRVSAVTRCCTRLLFCCVVCTLSYHRSRKKSNGDVICRNGPKRAEMKHSRAHAGGGPLAESSTRRKAFQTVGRAPSTGKAHRTSHLGPRMHALLRVANQLLR